MADHADIDHTGLTGVGGGLTDPMTTRGDVIVRNASNVTARLAKGSADTYLGSDGTDVAYSAVTDAKLSTSDITTNNASTSKHGFLKKLDNNSAHFMDGTGAWSTPAGAAASMFVRASHSTTQSLANATFVDLLCNTDDSDASNLHFTSASNLTGTVTKASGSAAIVGSGTSFTTELTVGQVIMIPGTADEYFAVSVITDNTHITAYQQAANSASGQTAVRVSGAVMAGKSGVGVAEMLTVFAGGANGSAFFGVVISPATGGLAADYVVHAPMVSTAGDLRMQYTQPHLFTLGDVVRVHARQDSGGSMNVSNTHISLMIV